MFSMSNSISPPAFYSLNQMTWAMGCKLGVGLLGVAAYSKEYDRRGDIGLSQQTPLALHINLADRKSYVAQKCRMFMIV